MKVVLFCGGLGLRIGDGAGSTPKPMVTIGPRPILWHVMKYYAHFGHKDFVLCLGHKAGAIKDYFLDYSETVSNDFVLSGAGRAPELLSQDIADWRITFVDTGLHATIGQRLRAVREHIRDEEVFLANYSDGLTDLHLPSLIDDFVAGPCVGAVVCVRPPLSYHAIEIGGEKRVTSVHPFTEVGPLINGGFFVLRRSIFDYYKDGEDLVVHAFPRLVPKGLLHGHHHTGFWASMDTFKDKQALEELYSRGDAPWELWRRSPRA
jgi:glucose-1-phosphate cytidylyltransferase